jgi:hypothetical protein
MTGHQLSIVALVLREVGDFGKRFIGGTCNVLSLPSASFVGIIDSVSRRFASITPVVSVGAVTISC